MKVKRRNKLLLSFNKVKVIRTEINITDLTGGDEFEPIPAISIKTIFSTGGTCLQFELL